MSSPNNIIIVLRKRLQSSSQQHQQQRRWQWRHQPPPPPPPQSPPQSQIQLWMLMRPLQKQQWQWQWQWRHHPIQQIQLQQQWHLFSFRSMASCRYFSSSSSSSSSSSLDSPSTMPATMPTTALTTTTNQGQIMKKEKRQRLGRRPIFRRLGDCQRKPKVLDSCFGSTTTTIISLPKKRNDINNKNNKSTHIKVLATMRQKVRRLAELNVVKSSLLQRGTTPFEWLVGRVTAAGGQNSVHILKRFRRHRTTEQILDTAVARVHWVRDSVFRLWNPSYSSYKRNHVREITEDNKLPPLIMDERWWFWNLLFHALPALGIWAYCSWIGFPAYLQYKFGFAIGQLQQLVEQGYMEPEHAAQVWKLRLETDEGLRDLRDNPAALEAPASFSEWLEYLGVYDFLNQLKMLVYQYMIEPLWKEILAQLALLEPPSWLNWLLVMGSKEAAEGQTLQPPQTLGNNINQTNEQDKQKYPETTTTTTTTNKDGGPDTNNNNNNNNNLYVPVAVDNELQQIMQKLTELEFRLAKQEYYRVKRAEWEQQKILERHSPVRQVSDAKVRQEWLSHLEKLQSQSQPLSEQSQENVVWPPSAKLRRQMQQKKEQLLQQQQQQPSFFDRLQQQRFWGAGGITTSTTAAATATATAASSEQQQQKTKPALGMFANFEYSDFVERCSRWIWIWSGKEEHENNNHNDQKNSSGEAGNDDDTKDKNASFKPPPQQPPSPPPPPPQQQQQDDGNQDMNNNQESPSSSSSSSLAGSMFPSLNQKIQQTARLFHWGKNPEATASSMTTTPIRTMATDQQQQQQENKEQQEGQ